MGGLSFLGPKKAKDVLLEGVFLRDDSKTIYSYPLTLQRLLSNLLKLPLER